MERAKALYNLIKERGKMTKREIMEALPQYFPKADDTKYDNCPAFYEAIDLANKISPDYLIVKKGVRTWGFGTAEEIKEMVDRLRNKAKDAAIRANILINRARIDGLQRFKIVNDEITSDLEEHHTILGEQIK